MKQIALGFFLIFVMIFQVSAHAADLEWGDLELYNQYVLNQAVSFPGTIEIAKGETFEILDVIAGEASLIYFQLHLVNCQNPDLVSEMILINPSPNDQSRDRSVGLQMDTGCNLSVWVEARDYYSASLFSDGK